MMRRSLLFVIYTLVPKKLMNHGDPSIYKFVKSEEKHEFTWEYRTCSQKRVRSEAY